MDSYDSDDESFSDELIPTDGYFSPRNHVQNTHVQLPSSSDIKATEATQGGLESVTASPPEPGRETRESHAFSEICPLLDVGPPPPAYSAAIASPYRISANPSVGHDTATPSARYGSMATVTRFNISQPPESMADPIDIEDGLSETRVRRMDLNPWQLGQSSRRILHSLAAVVGIVLMILILVLAFSGSWLNRKEEHNPHATFPSMPDKGHGSLSSACPYTAHAEEKVFSFSEPETFSFQEFIDNDDLISGGVDGTIHIQRGSATQQNNLEVRLSIRTSDHYVIKNIRYATTDTSLSINTPTLEQVESSGVGNPCLGVSALILIAPGVELGNLQIDTAHFDLHVLSGIDVSILNTTDITLIRGSLSSSHLDSRKTVVDVVSGSVKGVFALRDLLSITTKSGMIDVSVDPKNASGIYPAPAESIFRSSAGAITVGFPTSISAVNERTPGIWYSGSVPDRDFRTRVTSNAGAINGIFLHGRSTKLQSNSGSITASIHPLHAGSETTTIGTESNVGRTAVHISAPLFEPETPLRHLLSSHSSTSGSIQLEYPQMWEGKIRGGTGSGIISLEGKDVDLILDMDRKVLARKGFGRSELGFRTGSGSVHVNVGDV